MPRTNLMQQFERHARKFGADGIIETAADYFHAGVLKYGDVVQIQMKLDEMEREAQKKWAPKRRLTVEERVNRILGIEPEEATA